MQRLNSTLNTLITETGSTRPAALFRMAIAALLMTRYGPELMVFMAETPAVLAFNMAFLGCITLMFFGLFSRVSVPATGIMAALAYYAPLLGLPFGMGMHHHQYILMASAVLLCFMPCAASYSIDRILTLKREGVAPEETGTLWAQRLMVWQLCAVYFWTAIDKTNAAFMSGDRLERILEWFYAGTPLHDFITWGPLVTFASIAVLLVEYALPVLIIARRRLALVFVTAALMHTVFYTLLTVHTYSATMLAIYLLVADPAWLHRQLGLFTGEKTDPAHA